MIAPEQTPTPPAAAAPLPDPRKLGRFYLSAERIRQKWPELCALVFARVVVVRAEMLWQTNAVEYLAYSEDFEPVPEGVAPPEYQFLITKGPDGKPAHLRTERIK